MDYRRKNVFIIDHEPVQARPLEVIPRRDESPEKLIKRFVRKVRNDGILDEVHLRRGYEKPSVKRRRKRTRAAFLRRSDAERK